jgi:DNA polymerase elongation subunit (family B)
MSIDDIISGGYLRNEEVVELHKDNKIVAANGAIFSKDKLGFLPALMGYYYDQRVEFRNQAKKVKQALVDTLPPHMQERIDYLLKEESDQLTPEQKRLADQFTQLSNKQLAFKIILNSAYGSLSNIYFRYYNILMAEAITLSGQLSIRWVEARVNKYLNTVCETKDIDYVIACDTDSMYITIDRLVEKTMPNSVDSTAHGVVKHMDRICREQLEPVINQAFEDLAKDLNVYAQKMQMKREVLASKGVWTGKKHYALNVFDQEGILFQEPVLKIMGLEAIKTSTPAVCRDKIKEALKLIMNKDETSLQQFIENFRIEFNKLPFEEVASPRGVNNIREYKDNTSIFAKGCPINVKGSLIYNHYVKSMGLDKQFPLIEDGDKIKYAYLKLPNPLQATVIACPGMLPRQFKLDKYIDYDMQFEKSFLGPLRNIAQCIDWSVVRKASLDDLFV